MKLLEHKKNEEKKILLFQKNLRMSESGVFVLALIIRSMTDLCLSAPPTLQLAFLLISPLTNFSLALNNTSLSTSRNNPIFFTCENHPISFNVWVSGHVQNHPCCSTIYGFVFPQSINDIILLIIQKKN